MRLSSSSSPPHLTRRRVLGVLLLALTLWLLTPGGASAHAHLVQADPAPDSTIAHAPAIATFVFDEPLNPALTRVRITTAAGTPVTTNTGRLATGHNGDLWQLLLPALRPGTYSVVWTAQSATDGHIMSSFYTFRVAPSGGLDRVGAVTGAAAGVYGSGDRAGAGLNDGAMAVALAAWLGLMMQALWLGALVIDLAVLGPARRARETPEARLAWAAGRRLWALMRAALVVGIGALLAEVISLALQGTGGDWGRAVAPATLGGILSGQNGHLLQARIGLLFVALLVTARARVPVTAPVPASIKPRQRASQALGIIAATPTAPSWPLTRGTLAVLAAAYMVLVALSGHAANVTPGWLSYPIDWLHLVCTAAWAGGIAALAYGVLPQRHLLPPGERAQAVLPLLDRFSPVAYTAVGVLALSGLYNAVNHLDAPSLLADTTYGQLLMVKLGLVGVLILLSATHVVGLRPRIAHAQRSAAQETGAAASVHEGLATLAARLRLEAGVGAALLLATALMGQTLPPRSTPPSPAGTVPASITGMAATGDLRGQLTVAPPAIGAATFTLHLWEKGTPLTADTGAAIIHLSPAAQPALRATLDPLGQGTQFTVRGSLAAADTWRAEVLVRTAHVNEYRTLLFTFTVGPGAAFLPSGVNPDAITITITPGRLSAYNTVTIGEVEAPAVRLLSQSADMGMGAKLLPMRTLGGGHWRVAGTSPPMSGRWALTVQVPRAGAWISLRRFIYQVSFDGPMRLLTPEGGSHSPRL
jgi:copper transport protein